MDLLYKKAETENIDALIELKIKQNLYNCNIEGRILKNEELARKNIRKVLLQELNKTIYFFVAIDKDTNKVVACNGVVIHQMIPSTLLLNGKKAYITSVYTDEEYRHKGIQNILMQMTLHLIEDFNCKRVELDATNPYAIKLYQKFGFKKNEEKYILDN